MLYYIKGSIKLIKPSYIVIESNNIGYEVITPNPYFYTINNEVIVYIKEIIKEDSHTLYGFNDLESKDLFSLLLEVNGIGPKSALSILASSKVSDVINAINNKDINFLKRFPGIGIKTSQQIILDLSNKINLNTTIIKDSKYDDLYDSLIALGYKNKDIERIIPNLDFKEEIGNIIKKALILLNK